MRNRRILHHTIKDYSEAKDATHINTLYTRYSTYKNKNEKSQRKVASLFFVIRAGARASGALLGINLFLLIMRSTKIFR